MPMHETSAFIDYMGDVCMFCRASLLPMIAATAAAAVDTTLTHHFATFYLALSLWRTDSYTKYNMLANIY